MYYVHNQWYEISCATLYMRSVVDRNVDVRPIPVFNSFGIRGSLVLSCDWLTACDSSS